MFNVNVYIFECILKYTNKKGVIKHGKINTRTGKINTANEGGI